MKPFLVLSVLTTLSFAAQAAPMLDGVDIGPVVEHFRQQIVVLNKSVTTYNWAPVDPDRPTNESDLDYVRRISKIYWRVFGKPGGKQHMFGIGLYLAIDPAYTLSYGGYQDWQVIRVELPRGTRLLDLWNDRWPDAQHSERLPEVQRVLKQFNCSGDLRADTYLRQGGEEIDKTCSGLIRAVFRDHLQLDAFAYQYGASAYKECADLNQRAFVLTRSEWMTPDNIRLFTKRTTTDIDERVRIQTLLFKATVENQLSGDTANDFRDVIASHLDRYPDRGIRGSKTVCNGAYCVITITFCSSKGECDTVDLRPLQRPGGPTIAIDDSGSTQILWLDLLGKPKSPTISTWIKDNRFSCDGTLPWDFRAGAK